MDNNSIRSKINESQYFQKRFKLSLLNDTREVGYS